MQLFRPEALDFQRRRLLGDVMIMQPVRFMVISGVLTAITLAAAVFLYVGTYAQKKPVRGSLVPSAGLITVQAGGDGVVDEVHVEQGASVKRGEALVTIRRDVPDAEGQGTLERLDEQLAAQEAELRRRIDLVERQRVARKHQLETQIDVARAELGHLENILELNRKIASIAREDIRKLGPAVERGVFPEREMRIREQELLSSESTVFADRQRLTMLEGQIRNHQADLRLLPLDSDAELSALRLQLSELTARRAETRHGNIQTLNAPVSGTITDVRAVLGKPAAPGETLVAIRGASDPLIAELVVPTSVAGSVEPGKTVRISYDAFPYQRYGVYDGEILRMSKSVYTAGQRIGSFDVQEAAYKAVVRLDSQTVTAFDETTSLQPGMELKADIVLDERRLVEVLFGPLVDVIRHH